ncbi:MAG: 50S ribosomal protein L29 [Candidatus Pacebacteria bacterium]|nr:50S ribosomal protein L29 [Candidatus Paceibacterota bacterium]
MQKKQIISKKSTSNGVKTEKTNQKSVRDLQLTLQRNREKLDQLRFDLVAGKVKNVREVRKIKKEIARILTTQKNKLKT